MRALNPDVPVWLEGIVRKLHAKDPAKRFGSAALVTELLEQCLAHVQQPERHPLPPVAAELGRQVARALPRQPDGRRRLVFVALTLTALCAAMLWLVPRLAERQPDVSGPGATESAGDIRLPYDGPTDIDDFRAGSSRLRDQLDDLQRALWVPATAESQGLGPVLDNMRQRAALLESNFSAAVEPSSDPVDLELENVRRRLDQLQKRVGNHPE
jgi:hypothetical protein